VPAYVLPPLGDPKVLTASFGELLDPARAKASVVQITDLACPLLRELINFSSHAFVVCQSGMGSLGKDGAIASLRLHLHVIEMADGTEVLLREACGPPSTAPARGVFEAGLSLAFIHSHSDFIEASLAWLVGSIRREITSLRRMDPTYGAKKNAVVGCSPLDETLYRQVHERILKREQLLKQAHLLSIASRVTNERWYQPLCGASDLWRLSVRMDEEAQKRVAAGDPNAATYSRKAAYKFLYSSWANTMHGGDYRRVVRKGADGGVGIPEIRYPLAVLQVAQIVSGVLLEAIRLQIRKFRPDQNETMVSWYIGKVQQRFLGLMNTRVVEVDE
jgi:hypothetical protein